MQPRSYVVGGGHPQQMQPQRIYQPSSQLAVVPRGPQQQQMQVVGPNDPEAMMMMQIMQSFGAMGLPGFMGSGPLISGNPFDAFFDFSNLHQQLGSMGEEGTFVVQAQMTSIEIGPDGQPIIENYFQNNLGQHMNGQTISEKQQAYRNTAGINRIAEERMLNQQGRKIVKEKRGNDIEETNHYFNIDAEEAPTFDANWERVNRENKFLQDHGRFLGYANCGPSMIQMGPATTYQIGGPQRQVRAIGGPSFNPQQQSQPQVIHQQSPNIQFSTGQPSQSIRQSAQIRQPPFVPPSTAQSSYQPQPSSSSVPQSRLAQNPFFNRQSQPQPQTQQSANFQNLYQPSSTNTRF